MIYTLSLGKGGAEEAGGSGCRDPQDQVAHGRAGRPRPHLSRLRRAQRGPGQTRYSLVFTFYIPFKTGTAKPRLADSSYPNYSVSRIGVFRSIFLPQHTTI